MCSLDPAEQLSLLFAPIAGKSGADFRRRSMILQGIMYYVNSGCIVEVTLQVPDGIAQTLGTTPEDVGRRILESAAIEGYRSGRLSHRQVGELLGLDYWQAERLLVERGVPLNYHLSDLEADRATLKEVFGDK